ncbi:hypothetical protein EVAR_37661_1 [Eumeta japonica]|uniref:Uncharacterized protein n=1 Tax=Eumeta variegata TaxID=151549 RepID=A0A4C1Z1S6_EUMVA|nr:hypothetical protein EVAR_37661_1 [Eumeta japonica]
MDVSEAGKCTKRQLTAARNGNRPARCNAGDGSAAYANRIGSPPVLRRSVQARQRSALPLAVSEQLELSASWKGIWYLMVKDRVGGRERERGESGEWATGTLTLWMKQNSEKAATPRP